jgi:hypothetical protein
LKLDPSCDFADFSAFCDWVHQQLIKLDSSEKDAVVLETFAWIVARSSQAGSLSWLASLTQGPAFADEAEKSLPPGEDDDGDRRINPSKLPTWRRWLIVMGLLVELPHENRLQPCVVRRGSRELPGISLPQGKELEGKLLLQQLAQKLPYLDGGKMFANASKRIGHTPNSNALSPVLSTLLRDLHDQGTIELRVHGDAGNAIALSADVPHKVRSFHTVVLKEQQPL